MPTISGPLKTVLSNASQVTGAWIRASEDRPEGGGVVLDEQDRVPVTGGTVSFTALPGPAVLILERAGGRPTNLKLVIGQQDSSLAEAYRAGLVAGSIDAHRLAQLVGMIEATQNNAANAHEQANRARDEADRAAGALSTKADRSAMVAADTALGQRIDGKADSAHRHVSDDISDAVSNIASTPDRVLKTNSEGKLFIASASITELGDPTNKAYVDAGDTALGQRIDGKADRSAMVAADNALGQRIDVEKWKRGPIPAGTDSLDDLAEGMWTIGSANIADTLGLPAVRGNLEIRDATDGRTVTFVVLAGGTRRQEVWVRSRLQDTWQPWNMIYPLDDKADIDYVDTLVANEKWWKGAIPTGTDSLDDLEAGLWTIGSGTIAEALELPAIRGNLEIRDATDGRTVTFVVLAGGTRRQEVWVRSRLQDTWQPWNMIYPLDDKADIDYVDTLVANEKWWRGFIPAGTTSLDDLKAGGWTIGSASLADTLGLPAVRGDLDLRDVTDGRTAIFTNLAGGTRRQEVWVISKMQDTWQPWHRIYPLDDKADLTYVNHELAAKADKSTPASQEGDTVWAQVTDDGTRLPLGYGPDGHLDDHARMLWREDTLNLRTEDDESGYAYRLTSDKGNLLLGIEHDGRTTMPGLITTNHPREHYLADDGHLRPVHADMAQWSIWGSSSLDYIAQMLVDMAPPGTRVNDEANGGERAQHVAARLGSNPAILQSPTIPASGTAAVDCDLYRMTNLRAFTGTVAGIEVTFAWDTTLNSWAITRTTPGEEISLTGEHPLIPTRGMAARDHMTILWVGKNNTTDEGGEDIMVDITHDMIEFLTPLHKRVLILGHLPNDTPAWNDEATGHLQRLRTVNAELARKYGPLFIDLEAVIYAADIWERTGLAPTGDDLAAQAARKMPPSLTFDGAHLVEELNHVIVDIIDTRIRQLRWY